MKDLFFSEDDVKGCGQRWSRQALIYLFCELIVPSRALHSAPDMSTGPRQTVDESNQKDVENRAAASSRSSHLLPTLKHLFWAKARDTVRAGEPVIWTVSSSEGYSRQRLTKSTSMTSSFSRCHHQILLYGNHRQPRCRE